MFYTYLYYVFHFILHYTYIIYVYVCMYTLNLGTIFKTSPRQHGLSKAKVQCEDCVNSVQVVD